MQHDLKAAGTKMRYADRQWIHRRGDIDRALAVILEGEVSIGRLDIEGRLITTSVLGPGASFGEIPLLTGRPRTHDAMAVGTVRLLRISLPRFQALLTRQPNIRDHLLASLAAMLDDALDMLDSSQRFTVPQRVARFLLAHAVETDGRQSVAARQSDIAAALGVTREAVAAALRQFRADEFITTGYRSITVSDPAALRDQVGEV